MRITIGPIALEVPMEELLAIGPRTDLDARGDIAIGIERDVLRDGVLQRDAQGVRGGFVRLLEHLDARDVLALPEVLQRDQELVGRTRGSVAISFDRIAFVHGDLDEPMVRSLDAVELQTVSLEGELRRRAHGIGPVLGRLGATRTAAGPSAVVGASLRIRPARIGVVDDHVGAGACLRERMGRHQRSKAAYACDRRQQHPSPPMSIQIPFHRIPRSYGAALTRPVLLLSLRAEAFHRPFTIVGSASKPYGASWDGRRAKGWTVAVSGVHHPPSRSTGMRIRYRRIRDAKGRLPKQAPLITKLDDVIQTTRRALEVLDGHAIQI